MATNSSLTGAPVGLETALAARYELGEPLLRRRLAGGYANDVFLLEAGRRRLVVAVKRPPISEPGLAWEHTLVEGLAARLPEVPAPIRSRDGSTFFRHGDAVVFVAPYVEGRPADCSDADHRERTAALLARVHVAGRQLGLHQRPGATPLVALREALADGRYFSAIGAGPRPLPAELEALRGEIDAARDWALDFVESSDSRRDPATGLVHGDLFSGNVLCRHGAPVGLVDWEEARLDWAAFDLASGVWEFCRQEDGTTLDTSTAAAFVDAYHAAGGIASRADDELIVPLIRVRRILEILRAPYDRHVDWRYQLRNLEAFRNLG